MLTYSWLIPVPPLLAFAGLVVVGRRLKATAPYVGIGAASISLIMAVATALEVAGGATLDVRIAWFTIGRMQFSAGVLIDPLTAVMLVVVMTISLLVQVYSLGYMKGEKRLAWYYAVISLFTASMISLVIADNFLQLYISWELVGLCSYLLIGFWYEKKSATNAAMKAFIITRIGDVGFFVGLAILLITVGTVDFAALQKLVAAGTLGAGLLTVVSLLFFMGAAGKSAQFPLHVWLPDAMEGPTPASALIHAATMVAAGVYLVARAYFMFEAAYPVALMVVAVIGTFTAILAAVIAVTMSDIKRILAYSTISQLGYMMAGLGVGGYTAALFHLTTHAFFKALLFLGAGSVIHGATTQNIYEMGGLMKKMRVTGITFLIATLSITGIAPLAGFFSKDEILSAAFSSGHYAILSILLVTAFLTSFYMFRLYFVVFIGPLRDEHAHESPAVMTVPLIILAIPAVLLGFAAVWFASFVSPGHHIAPDYLIMVISTGAALSGAGFAYLMYKKVASEERFGRPLYYLYTVARRKFFLDEIYQLVLVTPIREVAAKAGWFEKNVIDGFVNKLGGLAVKSGQRAARFDANVVDKFSDNLAGLIRLAGESYRKAYTGSLTRYISVIFAAFIFLAFIVYILFVLAK